MISSCREDEVSYEICYRGETEWKELFTTHLVKSLNNRTTVEQAFTKAQNETTKTAAQLKVEQHPQIYDGINFLPTDVNRDGEVDLTDIAIVTVAFRSRRGSAKWNPLSDIDKNGAIDMRDIALVVRGFGSHIDI